MSIDSFFWRDSRDPYAIYDAFGDRYYTGGLDRVERLLLSLKLLEFK